MASLIELVTEIKYKRGYARVQQELYNIGT